MRALSQSEAPPFLAIPCYSDDHSDGIVFGLVTSPSSLRLPNSSQNVDRLLTASASQRDVALGGYWTDVLTSNGAAVHSAVLRRMVSWRT